MARLSQLIIQGDLKTQEKNGDNVVSKQAYTAIELFMHFFPKMDRRRLILIMIPELE